MAESARTVARELAADILDYKYSYGDLRDLIMDTLEARGRRRDDVSFRVEVLDEYNKVMQELREE